MEIKKYLEEKANLALTVRLLKIVTTVLCLALCINSFVLYYIYKNEKVVLVPPSVSTQTFIAGSDASDEYLRAMARYIAQLGLTYTPVTVRTQFNDLLKLFNSQSFPQYKNVFYELAGRVESGNVSSAFYVTKVKVDRANKSLIVVGILNQWTQDKKFITDESRQYLIRYRIDNGFFSILEIKEYKEGA